LGHKVTQGSFGGSSVKVAVPRCESCQIRNIVIAFAGFIGFIGGGCVGGLGFPSKGITTIIGGVVGIVPVILIGLYFTRMRGYRSVNEYPPLKALRAAGWEEPN
jgi:hypothetical protein